MEAKMHFGMLFTLLCTSLMLLSLSSAQDWTLSGLGDPLESVGADPGRNRKWKIDWILSDSFFYRNKSHPNFTRKWVDYNPTGWLGPGATLFNSDNVLLSDGKLVIVASHIPEAEQGEPHCMPPSELSNGCRCGNCFLTRRRVHTGYVSSKKRLGFPSFTECSMKISGTALSSNFWLKSRQTEIDVNESYGDGGYRRVGKTNVHIFFRFGGDPRSVSRQKNNPTGYDLSQGFHRYGVHWLNETFVEFYFDGMLIRSMELRADGIVDPTEGYLNEGMRVVLDLEAHSWRREEGVASEEELRNEKVNRMVVDWVRTYESVAE